jgi:hypothetical protein
MPRARPDAATRARLSADPFVKERGLGTLREARISVSVRVGAGLHESEPRVTHMLPSEVEASDWMAGTNDLSKKFGAGDPD